MKLTENLEIMEMDGEFIGVPIGGSLKGVLKLNETAASILEILKEEHSEEQVLQELRKKYENVDEMETYVHEFLGMLAENNLIQ